MLARRLFHSLLFTRLVLSRYDTAMLKLVRTLAKTRRINAHRKLAGDSLEARSGIIRRSALLFRRGVLFLQPYSSPEMVIQHATSSTRDALIPAFFCRPGINL